MQNRYADRKCIVSLVPLDFPLATKILNHKLRLLPLKIRYKRELTDLH